MKFETQAAYDLKTSGADVRVFDKVNIPQSSLDDLTRRILATNFPDKETVTDASQGVPLATIKSIANYWATQYDWRSVENRINSYPQFITEIDGLEIHFIHVRSKHKNALPIILTHGWPGSIIHQLKLIEPLTDPTAHGGNAEDAFDLVIPSLPGFGFSEKPKSPGWGPVRIAKAWVMLMKRLKYDLFLAQGGDWGAIITEMMAVQSPDNLLGIHTNMPSAVPSEINAAALTASSPPPGLSSEELDTYHRLCFTYKNIYYAHYMHARPQTLVALSDSPVGLASFMMDFDIRFRTLISRIFSGKSEGLTCDDFLDNATLFWLTNTAVSSARIYWENGTEFFTPKGVIIPVAVTVFPNEHFELPRLWAEQAYRNLIYYNKASKGGHFANWEQPELFTEELRASFRSLRKPF